MQVLQAVRQPAVLGHSYKQVREAGARLLMIALEVTTGCCVKCAVCSTQVVFCVQYSVLLP